MRPVRCEGRTDRTNESLEKPLQTPAPQDVYPQGMARGRGSKAQHSEPTCSRTHTLHVNAWETGIRSRGGHGKAPSISKDSLEKSKTSSDPSEIPRERHGGLTASEKPRLNVSAEDYLSSRQECQAARMGRCEDSAAAGKVGGMREIRGWLCVQIRIRGVFDAIPATHSTDTSSGSEDGSIKQTARRHAAGRELDEAASDLRVRWCQSSP